MPRLFTGLQLPPDIGFSLSLKRQGFSGARWIDPEDYHLTLAFVGDVDNAMADEVAGALEGLGSRALHIRFDGIDVFGGAKPKALFARVVPDAAIKQLQSAQAHALRGLGLKIDGRKFVPHVTLARLRGVSSVDVVRGLSVAGAFEPLEFWASEFVLLSSRQSRGGGPYRIEQCYGLDGLAGPGASW